MKQLKCPNCGAPLQNNKCEYCGTIFIDTTFSYRIEELKQENLRLKLLQELAEFNSKIIQSLR